MTRQIDWQRWLGRRLRLQDLHVFLAAVQHGSMAKAAAQLGVTQPAVSKVIADLEHSLGARLFDRSPQGVQPTAYGRALIKRSTAAFHELKQHSIPRELFENAGDLAAKPWVISLQVSN